MLACASKTKRLPHVHAKFSEQMMREGGRCFSRFEINVYLLLKNGHCDGQQCVGKVESNLEERGPASSSRFSLFRFAHCTQWVSFIADF